jgi:phage terminase large subunit
MNAVARDIILKPEDAFDWQAPDYGPIWKRRLDRLAKLRADPKYLQACRLYYKDHIADFIQDWGVTVDPRNAKPGSGVKRPVTMPFVLFPKQRELIDWYVERWLQSEQGHGDGCVLKSRDCGASWLAMSTAVSLCLFYESVSVGFGSAIKDKVDNAGDPDSLFYKGRMFIRYLPREFKGAWDERKCSADMRLVFPDSDGSITGECGDKIGRGGRKTIYFVDEFAFVERPKLVDANLIANTNCRIEISSVHGTANVFAEHARGGEWPVFDFDYHDDPRKCNTTGEPLTVLYNGAYEVIPPRGLLPWFRVKKTKTDPVVWNQEYERDFLASVEGIIIPQEWIEAAVDAHIKLNIPITGPRWGSFDVADQGKDKCCYASGQGILLDFIESWKGKGSNIYKSVERVFRLADGFSEIAGSKPLDEEFNYDTDGMGAGVRGDANKINSERETNGLRVLPVSPFWGSGKVQEPTSDVPGTEGGRKNEDFFENFKAQSWWGLRMKFLATYRAVTGEDKNYDPSALISLSSKLPELTRTKSELSQPVWKWSKTGKMMIDKTPDDVASPNNGDTVMMRFGYRATPWIFPDELFNTI